MNVARARFWLLNAIFRPLVLVSFRRLQQNERKSRERLSEEQASALSKYLKYCVAKVPHYRGLAVISPHEITPDNAFQVLRKFPVLTKEIIKSDTDLSAGRGWFKKFLKTGSTGGSTGTPLIYKISRKCNRYSHAVLLRGWGYAGYRPGDKLGVLAGGSLVGKKLRFRDKAIASVLGVRKYSSYGMNEDTVERYLSDMRSWGMCYLRGYVSAIFRLAQRLLATGRTLPLKGVFTTAEVLLPQQRVTIEAAFCCTVYDTYGLNDGGISAFECEAHMGMHVDMERAVLEVIDRNGEPVFDVPGRIVATSLINTGTPFVRYDTGDIGVYSLTDCVCGRPFPILRELSGRVTDSLEFGGCIVGSPVLTVLMSGIDVDRYQFVQTSENNLLVNIAPGKSYAEKDEEFIRTSLLSQIGDIEVAFDYSGSFVDTPAGKWKLVIDQRTG